MKVLISGAAGFIGSHIVDLLLSEGHTVWCVDDLSSGSRANLPKKIEFANINICNWFDLVAEFKDCEPDVVIHLAAQPSIFDSWDNPIRDGSVNVMGTLNMLRCAQRVEAKKFIFASTSAVYWDKCPNPIGEEFQCHPSTPYGVSKFAAETYVRLLMPENGTVLRLGNVYGPRQVPLGENQVIPRMIRHFEKGDEFFIHGDGEQRRDLIYVEDVAWAFLYAMDRPSDVFNIASGGSCSVNRLAKMLETIYDVPGYNWQHDEKHDPRRNVALRISAAETFLSWTPKVEFKEGLQKTVDWWKSQ